MKSHNGMRPQDIVVLLKLAIHEKKPMTYRDLSYELDLSLSEVSESLHRSQVAGLIDAEKKKVHRLNLFDFIKHGLRFVFPQIPGTLVTGIATSHSHPRFIDKFVGTDPGFVWPDSKGDARGLALSPLYKGVPNASRKDEQLYLLLAAVDMTRIGKPREVKEALKVINQALLE